MDCRCVRGIPLRPHSVGVRVRVREVEACCAAGSRLYQDVLEVPQASVLFNASACVSGRV